jgi:hypothetical protein
MQKHKRSLFSHGYDTHLQTLDNVFQDLFRREDLLDWFDVFDWMKAHSVAYESGITYDYYTFADYDAWVQFRMSWL